MPDIKDLKPSQLVKFKCKASDKKAIDRIDSNIQSFMDILFVAEDGRVKTHDTFRLDAYLDLLSNCVEIYNVQSDEIKKNLIFKAAFLRLKKYKNQDIKNFRTALAAEARIYLQTKVKSYHILFPLHGSIENNQKEFSILGQSLAIETWENIQNNYQLDEFVQDSKRKNPKISLIDNFTPIIIKGQGQNLNQIFDKSEEQFDLFRRLLNYLFVNGTYTKQWGGSQPLGKLLPSPVYGIFYTTGEYDSFYYNQDEFLKYIRITITEEHFHDAQYLANRLSKKNRTKSIESLLIEALMKYGQALETIEWRLAFLELWQILELLTLQSREQFSMKQVSSRIKFLLNDPMIEDLLEMLYADRNRLVHEMIFPARQGLEKVSLLKYVVERAINAIFSLVEDLPNKSSLLSYYEYLSLGDSDLDKRKNIISIIQSKRHTPTD